MKPTRRRRTRRGRKSDRYEGRGTWRKRSLVAAWRGMPVERNFPPARNVGDLAAEILKDLNLEDQLGMEEVMEQWKNAVGEPFASGTRPVALRHGALIISVIHPTLHFSIRGMEKDVLAQLQNHFGDDKIKSLKFQHGS